MISRQHFLQQLAQLSGAALLSNPLLESLSSNASTKLPQIGVQLYTIRDQIDRDIAGSLREIAALGFTHVETAFWPKHISTSVAAAHIRAANLTVASCHVDLPADKNISGLLDIATAFGSPKIIWHGWPEDKRYSDFEGTKELVAIYNECGRQAVSNGIQFGIHNHWWEYRNKVGGTFVYEILHQELHPSIFFELDTYWVKVAGHDPAAIIRQLGSRVKMLHVKDGPAIYRDTLAQDNPDPMTPVGRGTLDMPAIINAAQSHCEWLIIEMDKTSVDIYQALKDSLRFVQEHNK